ncbi:hypothetical protein ABC502_07810 [Alkalimonas sp. NCh-2]|uniref:hypothetical protein n=1 Tax=Alkalimonas sp. NCh-2 TaxID=3144846 RepID=UPI0031F6A6BE
MHKFESDYHLTEALNHLQAVSAEMMQMPADDPRRKLLAIDLFGNEVLLVEDKVRYLRNVLRNAVQQSE